MTRLLLLGLALLLGPAAHAGSPEEPAPFTCDGRIVMLRRSEIVPGGSIEGFLEATRQHVAWYRSHGVETNIQVVARVVERDAETGREIPSDSEIVTLHVNPPDPEGLPVGDEAWQAFVGLYSKNARIVDATRICLPDF